MLLVLTELKDNISIQLQEMDRSEVLHLMKLAWDLVNREIASKLLISRYEESTTVNEDEDQPK